jgi:hypothetical protein
MYSGPERFMVVPRIERGGGSGNELFRVADVVRGTAVGDAVRREANPIGLTLLSGQTAAYPLDKVVEYVGGSWHRYLAFAVRELPGRRRRD